MFTQISTKKGIVKFGEGSVLTIVKEYKQVVLGACPGKPVVQPIEYEHLTREDMNRVLEAVNLIKEIWDVKVKGRIWANGSKQRRYLKYV